MLAALTENYITRGFWGDEAWTALISQRSLVEIIRITSEDFHPPLYYFIVHFWINLFGNGEVVIRIISTIFFLGTVAIAYLLAKRLKGKLFAIFVSLLILTNPILGTYAFEARSYGLVAFFSMLTTYLFWQGVTKNSKGYQFAYIIAAAASLYTHYYIGFLLAAHAFSILFLAPKKILYWAGVFILVGVAYLPWVPTLISQVGSVTESYWIGPIGKATHYEFYLRLLTGEFETPQRMLTLIFASLLLAASLVLNLKSKKPQWKAYLFLLTVTLIPVIIPTVFSLTITPIFFYRYLIFLYIPTAFLISWSLTTGRLGKILVAILIALQITISWVGLTRTPYSAREEMAKVVKEARTDDVLVTFLPSFAEVAYYNQKGLNLKLYVLSEGLVHFSGKSLLDAYVRAGQTEILDSPPETNYWLVEPGPKSKYFKINENR